MTRDPLLESIARELQAQEKEADSVSDPRAGPARDDPERDADFEAALFRPLDGAAQAKIEASVLELTKPSHEAPAPTPAKVVPIAARRRVNAAVFLAPLALAAGLVLYMTVAPGSDALPGYQLDVSGGARALRGPEPADSSAPFVLAPGSQIEVVARPGTAVKGSVGAKAFFVQGVTMLPWEPAIEVSKDGAVRATVGAAGLPTLSPGRWELVVILARPEDVPADAAEARKVMASRERKGVLVLRRPIEVSP